MRFVGLPDDTRFSFDVDLDLLKRLAQECNTQSRMGFDFFLSISKKQRLEYLRHLEFSTQFFRNHSIRSVSAVGPWPILNASSTFDA